MEMALQFSIDTFNVLSQIIRRKVIFRRHLLPRVFCDEHKRKTL